MPFHKIPKRSAWLLAILIALSGSLIWIPVVAQATISIVINRVEAQYSPGEGGYDVTAYVSVIDENYMPISGLTNSNFLLREDGHDLESFGVEASTGGMSLVLAIDTSGSMGNGNKMQAVKEASAAFIQGLGDEDQVGLMSFNDQPKVEINITDDKTGVKNFIDLLEPVIGGATCLWDSAFDAVELASGAELGRRAVILLTDGVDERIPGTICSTKTLDDVIDLASDPTVQVPVYTIGIGQYVNEQDLSRVADLTGGRMSKAQDAAGVDTLFSDLALQLSGGYVLNYWSGTTSGEHNLLVQVDYSGARDQDTIKYRAPALSSQAIFVGIEDGQVISDDLQFSVAVSGEITPGRVEFYLDDQLFGQDEEEPYEGRLEIDNLQPDVHALRVVVYGSDGSVIAEAEVNTIYDVSFVVTDQSPSVSISFENLQPGEAVKNPITLRASLDDAEPVQRVAFLVDGNSIGVDAEPPYEVDWTADLQESGEHTLSLVAYGVDNVEIARQDMVVVYTPPIPLEVLIGAPVLILGVAVGSFLAFRSYKRRQGQRELDPQLEILGAEVDEAFVHQIDTKTRAVLTIEACQDPDLVGQCFEIWEDRVVIGRSEDCDVVIPVQPVSRNHAVIMLRGEEVDSVMTIDDLIMDQEVDSGDISQASYFIYDGDLKSGKSSTYGTFVDNVKVQPEIGSRLRNGCRIRIGRSVSEGRASPVILLFQDMRETAPLAREAELTSDELVIPRQADEESTTTSSHESSYPLGMEPDDIQPGELSELSEDDRTEFETEDFELIAPEDDDLATEEFNLAEDNGQEDE